jgi:hypothetical protein
MVSDGGRQREKVGLCLPGGGIRAAASGWARSKRSKSARGPSFPYDGTGNQLFRADRFDAYRELGDHSATPALEAIKTRTAQRVPAAQEARDTHPKAGARRSHGRTATREISGSLSIARTITARPAGAPSRAR